MAALDYICLGFRNLHTLIIYSIALPGVRVETDHDYATDWRVAQCGHMYMYDGCLCLNCVSLVPICGSGGFIQRITESKESPFL